MRVCVVQAQERKGNELSSKKKERRAVEQMMELERQPNVSLKVLASSAWLPMISLSVPAT